MDALSAIMVFIPVISFIGLMLAVRLGKLANIYLFIVITIATIITGIISLSVIRPLSTDPTIGAIFGNVLVATYIAAMLYGSIGVKTGSWERVIVAGLFVILVSLASVVG